MLWIVLLSLAALIMMGVDKTSAKLRGSRISERSFGVISILGGFPGVILGGVLFHHKTSKLRFWIPVIVAMFVWGLLFWVTYLRLI
ncbi:MAG TPA: DUF1294 domain-containing protein [Nitrososphaerales archaeon]|nr:DUF1294 domain-containing protein [Nitrososphaerales archaeon]